MSSIDVHEQAGRSVHAWNPWFYWTATGLFCVLFLGSAALTFIDPDGTRDVTRQLGFPVYFIYPQAVAKLLGVAAILSRRSRTLTNLAFAGFLYDMLLALTAHVAERDPAGWLAVLGLVLWAAAFSADRQRFGLDQPY